MKRIASALLCVMLTLAFLAPVSGQDFDAKLFEGPWAGKWTSTCRTPGDNAPTNALIQVDLNSKVATVIMFQDVAPPAPSFSSMAMGKLEGGKIIIDAASSGISGGGSKMSFWLEGPMLLRGTYENEQDCGTFSLRRNSNKGA